MVDIITLLKLGKGSIAILLFFSLSAFIFVHPIFNEFDNWGIHDWDHHVMEHAVERESILEHHQWPLWNPYKGGSFPALGHPRSICFSPLFILVLIWGPVIGVKLMALSCMFIGLVVAFKLAREWRISTFGRLRKQALKKKKG